MSDHSSYSLEDCGCRDVGGDKPLRNLPGQTAIRHRPDDYAGFKRAMWDHLRRSDSFRALTTRDPRDPLIALIDSGAAVCEMVAFYQDRWANQHYFGTATEPRALEDMAAQIGYQPSPALGADVLLAYTLTDAPGSPDPVLIPARSAAMSQPEGAGDPQFFATQDDLEARVSWNTFGARLTESQPLRPGLDAVYLDSVGLNLKSGDRLLIQRDDLTKTEAAFVARIAEVKEDPPSQRTQVALVEALPRAFAAPAGPGYPRIFAFRLTAATFGATAPGWRALPASLKREVLGLGEEDTIPEDQKLEWPNFHIHLPVEGELGTVDAKTYRKASTPESVAAAIKQAVAQRADTAFKSAQSEMASLGFAGMTSGISLVDTMAQSASSLFQASSSALADTVTDSVQLPAKTNIFLAKVLSSLRDLIELKVELPDFAPGDDREDALGKLSRFLTSLGGGFEISPGTLNVANLLGDELLDLMRATPLGWPLRLSEKLDETAPGESQSLGEKIAARAGVSLGKVTESVERVTRTFQANVDLALATQAKNVTEAALDAALAMAPPDQFASRRAFLAFVGVTASRFLTLPWRVNRPAELLEVLSNPGEATFEGTPALFAPEKFEPETFRASDFKNQAVTASEVAVLGSALSFLPTTVSVPMMGFGAFADLLTGDESENYALRMQDQVADTIEQAMAPRAEAMSSLAALGTGYHPKTLCLDAAYPVVVPGGKILLGLAGDFQPFEVSSSETLARASFGLSGKSTILTLNPADLQAYREKVRDLVVLGQSEELTLSVRPIEKAVSGAMLEVDEAIEPLPQGKILMFAGVPEGGEEEERFSVRVDSHKRNEAAEISLTEPLPKRYIRNTVRIHGNVVAADQGQSSFEVLGSGDPSGSFPSFTLKQQPITHHPVDGAEAVEQALMIEVDGRAWKRVRTFYRQPPDARVYITRENDQGQLTVTFGDGQTGARVPRGVNNIVARYRFGAGVSGNVGPDLIKAPLDIPSGVQGVTNSLAANGGTERQDPESIRRVAPLPTRALGRIVSRRDFESWALAYPGIAKARAETIWHEGRETIVLTIAGDAGASISKGTTLHASFSSALASASQGRMPFIVVSYRDRRFRVRARLEPIGGYDFEDAENAARELLQTALAFDARPLGAPVFVSEIIALVHANHTIQGVDLDLRPAVARRQPFGADRKVIAAHGAVSRRGTVLGADLLTLADSDDALVFEPFTAS